MRKLVYIFFLFISLPLFSKTDCIISLCFYKPEKSDSVNIQIRSNKKTYNFRNNNSKDSAYFISLAANKYEIAVFYKNNNNLKSSNYYFDVKNDEKRININIDYSENDSNISFVYRIEVVKIYNKPDYIDLIPKSGLALDSLPEFYLINNSNYKFYGFSWRNCFWGNLFLLKNYKWIVPFQVYVCGTISCDPLYPNSKAIAYIPAFFNMSSTFIKEPGKYKFSILFSQNEYPSGYPIKYSQNAKTFKNTYIVYEAESEFEVK